eukprot:g16025.t1
MQGRSCLTNLIKLFKEVTKVIEEGRAVDVPFMDFSEAFNNIPYGSFIQKIGSVVIWSCRFRIGLSIEDRGEGVGGRLFSGWRSVTSGVPMGPILGSLLFLIYINNLDENVDGSV